MNRRSSPRRGLLLAALGLTLLLALGAGGCGGGDEGAGGSSAGTTRTTPYDLGGSAERQAPKGAPPALREIYRQFPAPKADPKVKASAAAIKAGKKACAGKTPLEVKEAFYPIAIEEGGLEEDSPQGQMIADSANYEKPISRDLSFTAGQLAAGAYEATLPEAIGRYGFQGCIYSLALRVKHELAPKKAG